MKSLVRWTAVLAVAVVAGLGAVRPAAAQEPAAPQYQQVISANPFGLLLAIFNAEYERVVSESATAGFGGSTYESDDDLYLNLDGFWRFYLDGTPFEGWAFGAKAGITNIEGGGTHFGIGFDANHSWLRGKNDNFYIGLGFGLKRLFGVEDEFDRFIPTIRIVNIGLAF